MRRIPAISIVFVCILLISVGMIMGYFFGMKNINQKPNPQNDIAQNNSQTDNPRNNDLNSIDPIDDFELSQIEDEYIGPNTKITYMTIYLECNHSIEQIKSPEKDMVNMKKDQFEEYINNNFPNWKVTSFSHDLITINIEKNHLCPNHYVVGEKDGKIAIYKINENGERRLDKIIDNSHVSLLKEIDQKKLEKGIVVDSIDEISEILENFIS